MKLRFGTIVCPCNGDDPACDYCTTPEPTTFVEVGRFGALAAELEFDATRCVRCEAEVGPIESWEPESGHPRETWVDCYQGTDGELYCETCSDLLVMASMP